MTREQAVFREQLVKLLVRAREETEHATAVFVKPYSSPQAQSALNIARGKQQGIAAAIETLDALERGSRPRWISPWYLLPLGIKPNPKAWRWIRYAVHGNPKTSLDWYVVHGPEIRTEASNGDR